MSADLRRRAAALMRERAEAATKVWGVSEWRAVHAETPYVDGMRTSDLDRRHIATDDEHGSILLTSPWDEGQIVNHAASWHPAVALAVADWLDVMADEAAVLDRLDEHLRLAVSSWSAHNPALAVARTYLGETEPTT
jgi:hypothetical protein